MPNNKPVCALCKGQEWTSTSSLKTKPCICIYGRMVRSFLGGEIASAEKIQSPLLQFTDPPVDRSQENLFIKASWQELRSHLRWVLGCKYHLNSSFRFKVVTDKEILNVSLGNESFKYHTREQRDGGKETFNSVNDFIGDHDLVIVRLGWLGWKNQAATGYLKEALGIREAAHLPTWLSEVPGRYWGPGDYCWDDDVDAYVKEHFDVVDLRSDEDIANPPAPPPQRAPVGDVDDDTVGIGDGPGPSDAADMSMESILGSQEDRSDLKRSQRKRAGRNKPGRRNKNNNDSGPMGPAL